MAWKPRNDAHAIERVRVQFHFKDVLPRKALRTAAEVVEAAYAAWGFNGIEASSISNQLKIDSQLGTVTTEKTVSSGVTVRRSEDGNVFEEFALVEGLFGYVSTTYNAWSNFRARLIEIVSEPLARALATTDISVLKLEYWDGFEFDGQATDADARLILLNPDSSVPMSSIQGGSLWHSNVGWIENCEGFDLLINRNINTFDKINEGAAPTRQMGVYTLAEIRFGDASVSQETVLSMLNHVHTRSLSVFARCLAPQMRDLLGIEQGAYE